jgi:hypothetical protein
VVAAVYGKWLATLILKAAIVDPVFTAADKSQEATTCQAEADDQDDCYG